MAEQTEDDGVSEQPGSAGVNTLLIELCSSLREASKAYAEGSSPKAKRDACCGAVAACMEFAKAVEDRGLDLSIPLAALLNALLSLDEGRVSPLLEPMWFGNRPPDPLSTHHLRATAAAIFTILDDLGFSDAARQVARTMTAAGVKVPSRGGGRLITSADIRGWRSTYVAGGAARNENARLGAAHYARVVAQFRPRVADVADRNAAAESLLRKLRELSMV